MSSNISAKNILNWTTKNSLDSELYKSVIGCPMRYIFGWYIWGQRCLLHNVKSCHLGHCTINYYGTLSISMFILKPLTLLDTQRKDTLISFWPCVGDISILHTGFWFIIARCLLENVHTITTMGSIGSSPLYSYDQL